MMIVASLRNTISTGCQKGTLRGWSSHHIHHHPNFGGGAGSVRGAVFYAGKAQHHLAALLTHLPFQATRPHPRAAPQTPSLGPQQTGRILLVFLPHFFLAYLDLGKWPWKSPCLPETPFFTLLSGAVSCIGFCLVNSLGVSGFRYLGLLPSWSNEEGVGEEAHPRLQSGQTHSWLLRERHLISSALLVSEWILLPTCS